MCGIAGFVSQARGGATQSTVQQCVLRTLANISHRGFSQNEMQCENDWGIGANRLQIVDASNGRQPFTSPDARITGVLNGEVYNHAELRQSLLQAGYVFQTQCDTEVVVNAYHFWGDKAFSKFDGKFAVVLFDRVSRMWIAARDFHGIKPLYYSLQDVSSGAALLIASEMKALDPKNNAIREFLPGSIASGQCNAKDINFSTFIPESLEHTAPSFGEAQAATKLRGLISNAVRKRLQTSLPVAVFLSGGIDSSVVFFEAIQHHANVQAFVIGDSNGSDVIAAKLLCEELGVSLVHITVTKEELLRAIKEVVICIESFEPNHIRGGALSYFLSREVAKAGYRIALCGEGSDELFCGYGEFVQSKHNGLNDIAINKLRANFVEQLHRTQLQRVDRTAMRFTLEVRVPYLDTQVSSYARTLPVSMLLKQQDSGIWQTKYLLRIAYTGLLPDEIVWRDKVVLSAGAGFGSNGPEGIFYEYANQHVTDVELQNLQRKYSEFQIKDKEEALYFNIFVDYFGSQSLAANRPQVNQTLAKLR